jgi:hypothetical protein
MSRKIVAQTRTYQVHRNGRLYEFGAETDPTFTSEISGRTYPGVTQFYARRWDGQRWEVLHSFTVEQHTA